MEQDSLISFLDITCEKISVSVSGVVLDAVQSRNLGYQGAEVKQVLCREIKASEE